MVGCWLRDFWYGGRLRDRIISLFLSRGYENLGLDLGGCSDCELVVISLSLFGLGGVEVLGSVDSREVPGRQATPVFTGSELGFWNGDGGYGVDVLGSL